MSKNTGISPLHVAVGRRLKQERRRLGWSVQDMAHAAGMSADYVHHVFRGAADLWANPLAIWGSFGLDVQYVLTSFRSTDTRAIAKTLGSVIDKIVKASPGTNLSAGVARAQKKAERAAVDRYGFPIHGVILGDDRPKPALDRFGFPVNAPVFGGNYGAKG